MREGAGNRHRQVLTLERLYLHLERLALKGSQIGEGSRKSRGCSEWGEAMKGQGAGDGNKNYLRDETEDHGTMGGGRGRL